MKKRRLSSPSQQSHVPAVRMAAPAVRQAAAGLMTAQTAPRRIPGTGVSGREAALGRDYAQYAREEQEERPHPAAVRRMPTVADTRQAELEQVKKTKATLFSYGLPLAVALQKDLLDLAMIGSLPGIGSIVTICFSLLIFLLIHLSRSEGRLMGSRFIVRMGLTMIFGSIVEGFAFGLNFLPIETMVVLIIYIMDRNMSDDRIKELTLAIRTAKRG